jgi:hypothetical protein
MTDLTIIRRSADATISVYRGTPHLGLIYCPVAGRDGYEAQASAPFCDTVPDATFATEQEAINHLAQCA